MFDFIHNIFILLVYNIMVNVIIWYNLLMLIIIN